ncbi:MAG: cysteine desulfurase family protein [bacterium]|nr:cysteine desulfurase family protein [bacterium]
MKRIRKPLTIKEKISFFKNHSNNGKVGVRVYLDYAAATPLDPRVFKAMKPFLETQFGNPSSIHNEGVRAKEAITVARKNVAKMLQAHEDEIIFTSGGTEGNNLAILGLALRQERKGTSFSKMHFITTVIEHPSVKDVFGELERRGASVSYIPVDAEGLVKPQELKKALRKETVLVSVMYANSEIGTIQPISEIAKMIRNFRKTHNSKFPLVHTDASQAPLYLDVNVERLGADLMTFDGHKIYGPKGVGALFKKRNVSIQPLFYGGGQEGGLRPGTENVPGIVGFAEALKYATEERKYESARITKLRDYFIKKVLSEIPNAILNGDQIKRLPNNVNISFLGIDNEWLVLQLDARGIAVGTGSACLSQKENTSYVVAALGGDKKRASSSVRFTLGKDTSQKDLDYTITILQKVLDRNMQLV